MYRTLIIIGALGCIPYLDYTRAFWEIEAWPFLAAFALGAVSYALFLYKRRWILVVPHLLIASTAVLALNVFTWGFPFGGPGTWTYRYYAAKKFDHILEEFYSSQDPEKPITNLAWLITTGSEPIRIDAARTLNTVASRLGGDLQKGVFARYAIPALGKALDDSSGYVRREAALALRASGPLALGALPQLMARAPYGDDTASFSIETIGNLGPAASSAESTLIQMLRQEYASKSRSAGLRANAANALGKISSSQPTVSALQAVLDDPDAAVRESAKRALERIRSGN